MAIPPRVRPRVAVAELVDKEAHPLPPTITTRGEGAAVPTVLHWTTRTALVLLAVFVVALPLAGLLGVLEGTRAGLGFLGLALSTLTAAYLLGSD